MNIVFLIFALFAINISFGQTGHHAESKLTNAFSKINYWKFYANDNTVKSGDSLEKANDDFEKILLKETSANPLTLQISLKALQDSGLRISTSADGNFRIYSWDTWTGGTMHFFRNVLQHSYNGKVFSKTLVTTEDDYGDPGCKYLDVEQVTLRNKNYYLAFSYSKFSSVNFYYNVKVFSIDNGRLNDEAKLIKTTTGLNNELGYEVDLSSAPNRNIKVPDFSMNYDKEDKIISLQLIYENNLVTKKRIRYKYNGVCFVKL